jgi:hypothetical protein
MFLASRPHYRRPTMNFNLDIGIAVLERTPDVLIALLRDLPGEWTEATEGGETWSPRQVVAHLIVGETSDWIPRLKLFLEQRGTPALPPFPRFAHLEMAAATPLPRLLEKFASLRRDNLDTLRAANVSKEQLLLTAIHPEFGRVTLEQHLSTWVAHDLGHLVQIARTMARQYRDAAGPWTAYLSVLQPPAGISPLPRIEIVSPADQARSSTI